MARFFDKTDGVTPETALTVTSCKLTFMVDTADVPTLILDTAPTASGGANDMVHVTGDDAGFYDLELAAANVNYLGRAMLAITDAATHCPVFHEFMIVPALVYDTYFASSGGATFPAATLASTTNITAASGVALSATGLNAVVPEEPAGVPAWSSSTIVQWLAWLGAWSRNKVTQTATTTTLRNDADNATIATSTVSDDGTTFTGGEVA